MPRTNNSLEPVSQRRSRDKKKSKIKTASIILVGVVLLYLFAAIFVSVSSNLSTTVAQNGIVRENVRTTGYVFREQSIITSPDFGYLECVVNEGERVKEGQVLGYIFGGSPDAAAMEEIKELHRALGRVGINDEISVYTSMPATAEKRISELSRNLSDMRKENDLSRVGDKKEEINTLVSRKQNNTPEAEEAVTADQIRDKLSTLLANVHAGGAVIAPTGGVFTTRVDGLEDKLKYELSEQVTPSYLRDIGESEENKENETAEAGQPLCKIVNNYVWRFAMEMTEKEAENITVGQSVQLEFFDLSEDTITGTVMRISEPEDGKVAVVVSTNKYVEGIYSSSRINADVITTSSEGIKLPTQCLHVKDGVTGVYVVRLDVARFVPVNVKYKNDEWTIISAAEPESGGAKLQIYDEVIVDCRNLEDGKIIR